MKAPDTLTTVELKRLAQREKRTQDKREERARKATEQATAAMARNPEGYEVPPMPAGLAGIRKWVRGCHDAYSQRRIGPIELAEVRRSATSVGDLYRTGAELRKAEAAIRAAQAQEQMASALLAFEHGGQALVMLAHLQQGLTEGKRRPLPGRLLASVPTKPEPA